MIKTDIFFQVLVSRLNREPFRTDLNPYLKSAEYAMSIFIFFATLMLQYALRTVLTLKLSASCSVTQALILLLTAMCILRLI